VTDYLREIGISVQYLHSEIDAIERVRSCARCAKGSLTCWSHQSAARGARPPRVSLVAILDADKEGYLRSAQFDSKPPAARRAT